MPEKTGVRATLVVLLVVAGVILLIGWFVWSYKAGNTVPTAPKSTTRLVAPQIPLPVYHV